MPTLDRRTRHAIARRFGNTRFYVRSKLASDPVYAAVAQRVAARPLPLLDIGCGIGLLAHYLHACGALHRYLGLDHDARKIALGSAAARHGGLDGQVELRAADAASLQPLRGHVALLDVLHYLPAERQGPLLAHAARHLAPDGWLIVRNVLREPNWRFHATRVEEFFLRTSGWIPGGAQHYPSAAELRAPLEQAGLEVDILSLRGRTPFNSYLLLARHAA
jgi:2-polyprenyl-3-methyl-5-hydroxy-6-metoxy-1,4-benzoquinol methylase